MTHLGLRTEGELASLEGADLSAIRSLSFGDREDKAIKPPDLDLSGVDALTLRGNCKSLKRLFKAYGWAPKVRALYLPTSVVKGSQFLIEAGGLPALEALHLRAWINPKRLWAYIENQPRLRSIHINNQFDMALCERSAALPWWRHLETLRIEGADMGPRLAMALLNTDFNRLHTLQMASWTTYSGLGKAPTAPPVLRALAKRRSPLPIKRLLVGAPLGHGLEALAKSRAFPELEALYVKTQAFGTQPLPYTDSPLLPLQRVLDEPAPWAQTPGHRPAFEALMSLVERGVRVYVDR